MDKPFLNLIIVIIMLALTVDVSRASGQLNTVNNQISNNKVNWEGVGEITMQGFIKAKGKDLYTDYGNGEIIYLRGVNLGGFLFQEFWMTPTRPSKKIKAELDLYQYLAAKYGREKMRELIELYQANYFTERDFDQLAGIGVNVIRLPFWYMNIVDLDGEVREDWYSRFDWFLEEAGKRGIYVIFDFHGAPGSQNGSDHSGVDGGEDKEAASKFFYGDTETVAYHQELYYQIWELIAARYRDNPVVAGYDLLNEPYCTYRYNATLSVAQLRQQLWSVYDQAYHRIRALDPDHLIIMGATWDPVDLPRPEDYGWQNIMYKYHNYLYDDYNNAKGRQLKNMQQKLALITAADYNVPVLIGEFNYFNNLAAWEQGLSLLNQAGLHWTLWTYKVTSDNGNWGLYHHTGGDVNIERIEAARIAKVWVKVGDSRPNQRLIEVVAKYLLNQ